MPEKHAGSRVGHDLSDVVASLASLAFDLTILAVSLMAVRAILGTVIRLIDGLAAPSAHASLIFISIHMMGHAIDLADCLKSG